MEAVIKDVVEKAESISKKEKREFLKNERLDRIHEEGKSLQNTFTTIYLIENFVRDCIDENDIDLKGEEENIVKNQKSEANRKREANVNHNIRLDEQSLKYKVSFDTISKALKEKMRLEVPENKREEVFNSRNFESDYLNDIKRIIMVRNAVMHTSPITKYARGLVEHATGNLIEKILRWKKNKYIK